MYVTGKWTVWYEYTFTASTTVDKTICISALLNSIVIDTCVDLEYFIAWYKLPCTVAPDLGKYFSLTLILILAVIGKTHCLLSLSMWMSKV